MIEETKKGNLRFKVFIPSGFSSFLDWLLTPCEVEDWRRSTNHENKNSPTTPRPLKFIRLTESSVIRGGNGDGPQATKPAIEPKGQGPVKPIPHGGRILPPDPFL